MLNNIGIKNKLDNKLIKNNKINYPKLAFRNKIIIILGLLLTTFELELNKTKLCKIYDIPIITIKKG